MRLAYFDCFSGISGDMILGAMIDAGLEVKALQHALERLNLPGCTVKAHRVRRAGLAGTKADVTNLNKLPPFKTFKQIEHHLQKSALSPEIQGLSIKIFRRLAKAEAEAHGRRIGQVHLHEVGSIDTIIDVVGAVVGFSLLRVDRVVASPIHVGMGTIQTEEGNFPIPAPATSVLLKGYPIYATDVQGELATPTGAAIITTLSSAFTPLPCMTLERIGSGAGRAERATPNLLRLFIGSQDPSSPEDEVVQVETHIDDMNPQIYEHVIDTLFSAGAIDVFLTPIIMKRGRPAILMTILASPSLSDKIINILFSETTTLGVRIQRIGRKKLERKIRTKRTPYGPIRVKTAFQDGEPVRSRPEFRDIQRLAKMRGQPLHQLWEDVNQIL